MSTKLRRQVAAFHRAFDLESNRRITRLPDKVTRLCLKLIAEEFFELIEAAVDLRYGGSGHSIAEAKKAVMFALEETTKCPPIPLRFWENLAEVVDALADLDYVVESLRDRHGIDGTAHADEVQRANMAKLGPDGKPLKRADGKVAKPEGWKPPDHVPILRSFGWEPGDP
jgi:predicted HAD superfamily Cof-like phosphohydrolase